MLEEYKTGNYHLKTHLCVFKMRFKCLNFKGPQTVRKSSSPRIRGDEDLHNTLFMCASRAHISQKILSSFVKFPERVEVFWRYELV